MMGPFMPKDKPEIYKNSDLIFNCYGNDRLLVKYAISNKYYDGAIYRKPLLVSPNTSMAELSGDCAFALDLESSRGLEELYNGTKPWMRKNIFALQINYWKMQLNKTRS